MMLGGWLFGLFIIIRAGFGSGWRSKNKEEIFLMEEGEEVRPEEIMEWLEGRLKELEELIKALEVLSR